MSKQISPRTCIVLCVRAFVIKAVVSQSDYRLIYSLVWNSAIGLILLFDYVLFGE